MDIRQLVCLNNGNGTQIDIHTNTMSCLDLTLVSNNIATSACACALDVQINKKEKNCGLKKLIGK